MLAYSRHWSQLEKRLWTLCYVGWWFESQSAVADSSASLFSSITYATLHCNLALSYLVNRENSAGLLSFQLLHHLAFLLFPRWQIELKQFWCLSDLLMLCKEEDSSNTFSVQGSPFLLESVPVSMSVPCAAEDAESSPEGRWGHGAELEAQIASVDSFVSCIIISWGLLCSCCSGCC